MKEILQKDAYFDVTVESCSSLYNEIEDDKPVNLSAKADHCHIIRFNPEPILKSDFSSKAPVEEQIAEFIETNIHYKIHLWFDYNDRSTLAKMFIKDWDEINSELESRFLYRINIKMRTDKGIIQDINCLSHIQDALKLTHDESKEKYISVILFSYNMQIESGELLKDYATKQFLHSHHSETVQ